MQAGFVGKSDVVEIHVRPDLIQRQADTGEIRTAVCHALADGYGQRYFLGELCEIGLLQYSLSLPFAVSRHGGGEILDACSRVADFADVNVNAGDCADGEGR
jgi:hypothetical protein